MHKKNHVLGGTFAWAMITPSGKEIHTTCKVVDIRRPELIKWHHTQMGFTMNVTFEETENGETVVKTVQENAPVRNKSEDIQKWVDGTLNALDEVLKTCI